MEGAVQPWQRLPRADPIPASVPKLRGCGTWRYGLVLNMAVVLG